MHPSPWPKSPCREVLRVLAMVDCKDRIAEELHRKPSRSPRCSVMENTGRAGARRPEHLTTHGTCRHFLADWGLIQIVGRGISDPIAPGPSALRLTYAGRVCIGLAPALNFTTLQVSPKATSWTILHSASESASCQAQKMSSMRTPPRWSSPPKAETQTRASVWLCVHCFVYQRQGFCRCFCNLRSRTFPPSP